MRPPEVQEGALKGCGAPNPDRYAYGHKECQDQAPANWWGRPGPTPRACIMDGAHIHSWARPDARYCSARCRMKALRARKANAAALARDGSTTTAPQP